MRNNRAIIGAIGLGAIICIMLFSTLPQTASGNESRKSDSSQESKTLNEINDQLKRISKSILEKENRNVAFLSQGPEQAEACVWDNESQKWYTQQLSGQGGKIVESYGNFCAYAQAGNKIHFAAWNKFTKRWSQMTRHADMIDIVPCNGNFGFFTSNQDAGVWTSRTDSWNTRRIVGSYIMSAGADNPPRYQNPADVLTTEKK